VRDTWDAAPPMAAKIQTRRLFSSSRATDTVFPPS